MTASYASSEPADENRQALFQIYSLYRLGISVILASLFFANTGLGSKNLWVFTLALSVYFGGNLLLAIVFRYGWYPRQRALLWILGSDIILLQLISATSGATQTGMGVLLVASVATGSIFLDWPRVMLVPALATLTELGNVAIELLSGIATRPDIVASGWLGIIFFATCFTIQYLVTRLQSSEAMVQQEAELRAQLQKLNSLIIERMQTGVVVLDASEHIVLCNAAASSLLSTSGNQSIANRSLVSVSPKLHSELSQWKTGQTRSESVQLSTDSPKLKLGFVSLSDQPSTETMVFIEDFSKLTQHAQQLKLASLGQLTASIAHEIRNPLGAISHAAQLLDETSPEGDDKKLTRIIGEQTRRVNSIIQSVLSVSSGKPAQVDRFSLASWLEKFLDDYNTATNAKIDNKVSPDITISFDKNQLGQILTNLLDNGLRYSGDNSDAARISLKSSFSRDELPVLEIIDYGPGIAAENLNNVFEPFFTTEKSGSGLGLYICRELCEANQARITYHPVAGGSHSQFKIHFAHPNRSSLVESAPGTTDTTAGIL